MERDRSRDMDSRQEDEGLSPSEKILQLQDQWDEIAGSPDDLDLTTEQLIFGTRTVHGQVPTDG